MKKQYLEPATQERLVTMCQLIAGSYTPGININEDLLEGNPDSRFYGG